MLQSFCIFYNYYYYYYYVSASNYDNTINYFFLFYNDNHGPNILFFNYFFVHLALKLFRLIIIIINIITCLFQVSCLSQSLSLQM